MQQFPEKQQFEEVEGNSPADLIYKFLPYWPLLLIFLTISFTIAWLYLRYTLPVYESTATLLIKENKQGTDPLEAFDIFSSTKIVENEIRILKSKTLMQEVVKNLHLYSPVTVSGRVLDQSGYLLSPVIIELQKPDLISTQSPVDFTIDRKNNTVSFLNSTFKINEWVTTPFGVLRFLSNPHDKQKNRGLDYSFLLKDVQTAANQVLNRLTISPSGKQSTVIDLNIQSEVPKQGEDILNELISVYNNAAVVDKNSLAANTLKFVEDRLKFVVNELDSVEGSLQNYRSKNKIVDISSQGQIFLQTVAANDEKISDINMQLAVLDQVENYVKGNNATTGGIVPSTLGLTDPGLTALLQNLSQFELQYAQTKKIVPENNPSLLSIQQGIDKLKPGILENIQSQKRNLTAGRRDLNSTNDRYTSMLRTIPEKERELLSISRQQAIKNNIYTFLLQKREDAALSFASTVADSRIIDRAESGKAPVSPKRTMIYLLAGAIALVLFIAVILLKELLARSVQDRSEIEKFTSIPVLGEVLFDNSKSGIVIEEGQRSFIAEQFRQLRTSLGYMGINEEHKKILITSSISGEGKSFIALNLGISLSLLGKKVIMLELDLRKPKLSDQLKISRATGVSNYLIGTQTKEQIIKPTGIQNLYLIPSGPIPPNPAELISKGLLVELLQHLEEQFEYILVDTAPVNPVTDAFIISPLCDVTLFVIRHGYTPKLFVQKLENNNKANRFTHPAIVYNGIKGKGFSKYGYGYGYGYGYTEEHNHQKSGWKRFFKA